MTGTLRQGVAIQDNTEAAPVLLAKSVSVPSTAAETATDGSCEKGPPEKAAGAPTDTVSQANVESPHETPAVSNASGEKVAVRDSVEQILDLATDSVYERPTEPAEPAEPALQSGECRVESAAVTEAPLRTTRKELFDCKVQPADNTIAEQSIEPMPKRAND